MKKYTEEEWNRLSKKEKSNVKQTAAATVVALITVGIWKELTKSGKWSVFRWWVLYFAFMGSGLFTTYREQTPFGGSRASEIYWLAMDDNGFAYFILITIGITIFYIYRNNFFKFRINQKKLSITPLIIFFFFSIAISQFGRYHISKQKVPGQKRDLYYTNPLSFFQKNNSTANYSSKNQLEESSPIADEEEREAKNFLQESQQNIKEIIPKPSDYLEPVNPVPNYDDPGGVSENIIDISDYEEEVEIEKIEMDKVEEDVEVPFAVIENVPVFPGCENGNNAKKRKCMSEKIARFVLRKFNTDLAGELGLSGRQRINVIFKIDKTGNVIDVRAKAQRGSDTRLEKEAVRVINSLPKMQPGKQRGKVVIVPFSLPIIFDVKD